MSKANKNYVQGRVLGPPSKGKDFVYPQKAATRILVPQEFEDITTRFTLKQAAWLRDYGRRTSRSFDEIIRGQIIALMEKYP